MTENTSQPAAEFKADFNDLNYFKNIYHQEYIRTAHQSGKKYRSLNGAVQRAVVEKAMLRTEAYKFSRYGQGELNELTPEKRKERTEFIFQKYFTSTRWKKTAPVPGGKKSAKWHRKSMPDSIAVTTSPVSTASVRDRNCKTFFKKEPNGSFFLSLYKNILLFSSPASILSLDKIIFLSIINPKKYSHEQNAYPGSYASRPG